MISQKMMYRDYDANLLRKVRFESIKFDWLVSFWNITRIVKSVRTGNGSDRVLF